jgi:N-acetylmuramoyl-L-alanine amidase
MGLRAGTVTLIALALHLSQGAMHPARGETAAAVPAAAAPATPSAPMCDKHKFRVVVDVGHTERVPGAKSARGFDEYDFNLRLARVIHKKLIESGFERTVLLITAEAPRAGLFKRADRANALSADLFLAVHHDSVPDHFMQKWQYEGEDHGYSDRFPGHSLFISAANPQYGRSLQFGKLLGEQLKAHGLKYTPHYTEKFMGNRRRELVDAGAGVYRYDQLVVLMKTHMPAVLLEAGSIINRDEEVALETPQRRSLIADSVAGAVESFCGAPAHRNPEPPAHSAHAPSAHAPKVSGHAARPVTTGPSESGAARQ